MTAPVRSARPRRPIRSAVLALTLAGSLAGCGDGAAQESADGGTPTVVTTTSVYADVVRVVGGEAVAVDPIIDSTAQDPHSYEATARDRLAVEQADLVVLNGGGYDVFMEDLADAAGVPVVDAVAASRLAEATGKPTPHEGHEHDGHVHGGVNEHVWYDLDSMDQVAETVADRLAELDPAGAETYRANARAFADELAGLREDLAAAPADNAAFVATEPVAVYLLEDAGLHNDTPAEFTAAIENGTDVAPLVLQQVREQILDGHVQLLAFNAQTASGQTEQLRDDVLEAGTAVVEFTETLPENTTYVEWMTDNVTAVSEALADVHPTSQGTAAA